MRHQYVAQLEDGTIILSRRYGQGWSEPEAWGHFCCEVWDRARAAGSKTVVMGGRYSCSCMKLVVPEPPTNMSKWTMLTADRLPGIYKVEE